MPYKRIYRKATIDNDWQKVRSYIVKYICKFHNHPIMETLCCTLKPTQEDNNNNGKSSGNVIL